MREMSATEFSRNLSRVLDAAEGGETIAVVRNGERIALLVPAPRANGAAVAELLRSWRGKLEFGPEWDEMLEEIRSMPARLEDPWRD